MYVVSLFIGELDNDDFLGPNYQTLLDLGGKVFKALSQFSVPEQDALRYAAVQVAHANGSARELLSHPGSLLLLNA